MDLEILGKIKELLDELKTDKYNLTIEFKNKDVITIAKVRPERDKKIGFKGEQKNE